MKRNLAASPEPGICLILGRLSNKKSLKHRGNETGNDERVIFTKEERIFKFDDKAPENTEESAFGNNVTDVILVPDWLTIESFTAFRHCSH